MCIWPQQVWASGTSTVQPSRSSSATVALPTSGNSPSTRQVTNKATRTLHPPPQLPARPLRRGGPARRYAIRPPAAALRVMVASQAWTEPPMVSMVAGSMASTRHPPAKAALSSSRVTRRGPRRPGWRSLKHSRYRRPPSRVAAARSSSSRTWNRPESSTVSNRSSRAARSRAFQTRKRAASPRSAALAWAAAMAAAATSTPVASSPSLAASRACSPLPQPASSTRPRTCPASARARNAGWGRPMSQGGVPAYRASKSSGRRGRNGRRSSSPSPALTRPSSSPGVTRPPVGGDRGGRVELPGGRGAQHQDAPVLLGRPLPPPRPGHEGRPLPGLPPQPLVEPGDPAAVAQRPQLVPLPDDPSHLLHDRGGQPQPPPVPPGGHPLDIPGRHLPPPGDQHPRHHRPMGHRLPALGGQHVGPPEGVLPVVLVEPPPERLEQQPAQGHQLRPAELGGGHGPQPGHASGGCQVVCQERTGHTAIHASSRADAARRGGGPPQARVPPQL